MRQYCGAMGDIWIVAGILDNTCHCSCIVEGFNTQGKLRCFSLWQGDFHRIWKFTRNQRGQRCYGLGLLLYGGDRYGHTGTIEATHAMAMNRGDGVTWAITVSGPYPDDTPRLESIINRAFEAGGLVTT